jgi:Flp pilus assembly pilin Flp
MHIKNKRGQSTVEYILLVTAVIAVMIVFAASPGGPLQTQLNTTLNTFATAINSESSQYSDSHVSAPGGSGTPGFTVNVNPS